MLQTPKSSNTDSELSCSCCC